MNTRPHPYQGCALPLSYGGDPGRKGEAKSRAGAPPSRRRNIGKDGCGRKPSFARTAPRQSQQNRGLPASSASLSEAVRGGAVATGSGGIRSRGPGAPNGASRQRPSARQTQAPCISTSPWISPAAGSRREIRAARRSRVRKTIPSRQADTRSGLGSIRVRLEASGQPGNRRDPCHANSMSRRGPRFPGPRPFSFSRPRGLQHYDELIRWSCAL